MASVMRRSRVPTPQPRGSGPGGDEVNEGATPHEDGDQRRHRPEHEAPHQFVPHHGDAPANESAQVENDGERW